MKKIFRFLQSMRFGLILLGLIAAFSVVGTVIPQGQEISWYAQTYQRFHGILLSLRLHDIFNSWVFQLLLLLLGLNLLLCSVLRIRKVARARKSEVDVLAKLPVQYMLTASQRQALLELLRSRRCREETMGSSLIFRKNGFGRYGSFLTHLSILLTLIFGALALYLPTVTDQTCFPGESLTLPDSSSIAVESFRIEDENGRLDFASELRVTLPDGRDSGLREIRVNHPLSFGPWKIYQQTYGTAGSVTVTNLDTGGHDTIPLSDVVFLSLDGVNGLWYRALYPDMIRDPSGNVTLITKASGSYPNPVYHVETVFDGIHTPVLASVGDELQVGTLKFRFEEPVEYPGLRLKYKPPMVETLLCAAFALMCVGLYITFFCQPVLVRVDEDGCAVGGSKPEAMHLTVQTLLEEEIS